jgi:hypothetical protein
MKKTLFVFLMICAGLYKVCGQTPVPVFEEPRHKPVFTNNYLRIIQARIMDKDTSLYHIHATPSCFVFVKPANYDNQVLGEGWTHPNNPKGYAWYSSFAAGPAIHRVAARPHDEIFAYDVEILNPFNKINSSTWSPLSRDTIFITNKAAGYRIKLSKNNPSIEINERGPIVAILLTGTDLQIKSNGSRKSIVKETGYSYLPPNKKHKLELIGETDIEIILFEVK